MEYVTFTQNDPDFRAYLLGTFSLTHRALPVETYHADTPRERVTFRIVSLGDLNTPPWWYVYFRSARPELLGLTLGPAVAAWLNQREWIGEWSRWPSWLALLSLFFLHTAVFLLNDVQDHLQGLDRLNRRRGSQVIQRGWVTAHAMKKWAGVNLILALALGVPAVLNAGWPLLSVVTLAAGALAILLLRLGTRWGLTDLALALLFGPLLTAGIALASFGASNIRDLLLGSALGLLTLWVFQARQFEYLFRSSPRGFRTFVGHWNFERARAICVGEGLALLLLQPAIALLLGVGKGMWILLPLVSLPLVFSLLRLWQAASPLASSLVHLDRWALTAHAAWTLWWISALGMTWL